MTMLTPISQSHLAALEAELLRVTAQRDALRDAAQELVDHDADGKGYTTVGDWNALRNALQACQD